MNRLDFLHQLYLSLEGIPDTARRNMVHDYEATFHQAEQEGRTEEEASTFLGDPVVLAENLRAQFHSGNHSTSYRSQTPLPGWTPVDVPHSFRPRRNRPVLGGLLLGAGLLLLVLTLLFAPMRNSRSQGIEKSVINWFQNIGPGETYQVDETKTAKIGAFTRIEIHTDSPDMVVHVVPAEEITSRLHGTVNTTSVDAIPTLSQQEKGDTLVIRVARPPSLNVGFFSSNLTLNISLPGSWKGDLALAGSSSDISLPEGTFTSLTIQSVSGDVVLGTLHLEDAFQVETSSGEIRLTAVTCQTAHLKTVSGDKHLDNLLCKGVVDFSSSSGSTTLSRLEGKKVTLSSVSGDVRMEKVLTEFIKMNGSSSSIRLSEVTGDTDIQTVSGDVILELHHPGKTVKASTSSGKIRITFPDGIGLDVTAKSSSGNMKGSLSLTDGEQKDRSWTGTRGDKAVRVSVSTASGDIHLD